MQVTETLADGLKRQFIVTLPAGDIDSQVDRRLRDMAGTIRLPGFRPGKVPMGLLKKRYGSAVLGEVLEKSVQDSSAQAIRERGLRPALQPKIEVTKFTEGADLEYTLAFETLPDIQPVDFGALEFERLKAEAGDTAVDEALERLRAQGKRTEPVSEARPTAAGDTLVVDYEGRVDGTPFEGGTGTDQQIELGSNRFIPGFEEQLIGLQPPAAKTFPIRFPDEYPVKTLAGRDAEFTVTAKELRQSVPVVLDDDFAKQFGAPDLAALRQTIREQLEREYAGAARQKLKRQLLDKLAELHAFAVPDGMVEAEFDVIWKQVEDARAKGAEDPDFAGKSEDEVKAEYRSIAERRVRLGLLLSEVGRLNNITVADDELRRAVVDQARRYPGHEREVIEFYRANRDAMDSLRAPLFEEKTVDFILEMAKLTERVVSPEELLGNDDKAE